MEPSTSRLRSSIFTAALVLAVAASLVFQALAADSKRRATTASLGGEERYLTHVSTDKPIYRVGDPLFVRGVVLHAHTGRPLPPGANPTAQVEIKGPKGESVGTFLATSQDSVVGFRWDVAAGLAGGEYRVKVSWPWDGHAPAERRFEVRAFRPPRLKNQIVFVRDGYGPGDTVVATLHTERAEGGIPAGAAVDVIARVDGAEVHRGRTTVDGAGNARAEFALPAAIERGEGTLAFVVQDGGVVETAAKTLPILLQTVDLRLFPEGGDLVDRLATRVYLEARTPADRPADVAGVVEDASGRTVATFRTEHEGRGRFAFTPSAGATYTLRLTEPAGIATTWTLPKVKRDGGVVRAVDVTTLARADVRLEVGVSKAGTYLVTLSKRELPVASARVRLPAHALTSVSLDCTEPVDGVLVATLWSEDGEPVAERLVFREPSRALHVRVAADAKDPVPGEAITLTVETTDDDGNPVPAVVGLTVTDESVIELLEKREQAPRLPVMVLLEDDVEELADAHVYLDPENDEAPVAVDLLLGTQGWRRFAFVDPVALVRDHGDRALRTLALRVSPPPESWKTATEVRRGAGRDVGGVVPGAFVIDLVAAPPRDRSGLEVNEVPAGGDEGSVALRERPIAAGELAAVLLDAQDRDAEDGLLGFEANQQAWQAQAMVVVREYAHLARPDRRPGERVDFTETLYWHAGVATDAETGRATVTFALNDAVTSFRVLADAFDADGALGAATETIASVQPFYVEPKLPLEVTAGDLVRLPVYVVNGLGQALRGVTVALEAGEGLRPDAVSPFDLAARERARRIVSLRVGDAKGAAVLTLRAAAGGYADAVTRMVAIVPRGFPAESAFGGLVDGANPAEHEVTIPTSVVPNSVRTEIALYPTPLASLTGALERLLQEPSGCFEQTSSTTYPLVMAQQYFTTHAGVDPSLVRRSKALLEKGYQRLKGFECRKKGYEWFGEDPGHEALSAFGVLEFTDMAAVHDVDRAMIDRTRGWLLAQRDGKGRFARKRRALHTWIEDQDCSDGYILWALLESGEPADSLTAEVDAFERAARKSENAYVVALGANVMALAGRVEAARALGKDLVDAQEDDGHVGGATQSIVGSRGDALDIETTSLAALAWLRDPAFTTNVEASMRWLTTVCEGGRFGSTQSTVLALRAIVAYDAARARPEAPGRVRVVVDGQPVGDWVAFGVDGGAKGGGAIALPDVSELLTTGSHRIALQMEDGAALPYGVTVRWHSDVPDSSAACRVDLATTLSSEELVEGDVAEAYATVTNRTEEQLPTVVAIIGLPGGLEPRHDRLKELKDAGAIDAWEVRGREVIVYWRGMKPAEERTVAVSLVAAVPGTYAGPASRAYEYYGDEHKVWAKPLEIQILPK